MESDAVDVISSSGEGPGAIQSLSRQVAFLKREYEKVKLEKRQLKDHLDKLQFNESSKTKKVQSLSKECEELKDQLEHSEGDLKLAEKHLNIVKQKNEKLVSKLKKVSQLPAAKITKDLDSSSFTELLKDSSKMQAFSSSTPKLNVPSSARNQNIDLESSFDLFTSPDKNKMEIDISKFSPSSQKPSTSQSSASGSKRRLEDDKCENEESSTKVFKITSASESNTQKLKRFKSDSAVRDPILKFASMNIFKKKGLGERFQNQGSVVQKGFDGLGGHTTHINPLGNPFIKPKAKKSQFKSKKTPDLPKLDNFLVID